MTTETILTEELIDELAEKYLWGDAQFIGAGEVTVEGEEEFARAIEQAVLQSPEVQALRKDAERYRWLRDMIENQDLVIAKVGSWSLESWSGDDPDHYIDAAMEQQT